MPLTYWLPGCGGGGGGGGTILAMLGLMQDRPLTTTWILERGERHFPLAR